jgi:hypothetical protein
MVLLPECNYPRETMRELTFWPHANRHDKHGITASAARHP